MKSLVRVITIIGLTAFGFNATAQVQDPYSPGYDENYQDTSYAEESYDEYGTEPKREEKPNPFLKPYERITMPFDSVTNLITYEGVVEQEESGSDSLYIRAKRWAELTFGKGVKTEMDKRNQKIIYNATVPAYTYRNPYNKRPFGTYDMKFTILIKEGRYKYIINNLVHEMPKPSSGGKGKRNYFEYYYTTNSNVQVSDRILRYADKDVNDIIASFKKAMAEPIIIDEDDW